MTTARKTKKRTAKQASATTAKRAKLRQARAAEAISTDNEMLYWRSFGREVIGTRVLLTRARTALERASAKKKSAAARLKATQAELEEAIAAYEVQESDTAAAPRPLDLAAACKRHRAKIVAERQEVDERKEEVREQRELYHRYVREVERIIRDFEEGQGTLFPA